MIKKYWMMFLFLLFITSCDPMDDFPKNIELTGIECQLTPQKEIYEINDELLLLCNIEADFDKFSVYYINVSVWNPQNHFGNTSGIIKVLNEQNEDIVNDKNLTLTITNTELEDGKIIEKLKIVPLCKGEYELVITVTTKIPGDSNGVYYFTESKRISVR